VSPDKEKKTVPEQEEFIHRPKLPNQIPMRKFVNKKEIISMLKFNAKQLISMKRKLKEKYQQSANSTARHISNRSENVQQFD